MNVTVDTLSAAAGAVATALADAIDLAPTPIEGRPGGDLVPGLGVRAVRLPLGATSVLLAVNGELGGLLEQHLGALQDALAPALGAAADALGLAAVGPVEVLDGGPFAAALANAEDAGAVRLVHDDEPVAALVLVQEAPAPPPAAEPAPVVAAPAAAPHEFAPLGPTGRSDHGGGRSMELLADVEMGVTAELGRARMFVRDIVALTPGAVIELDRAAGSPVDVLVNGTLIARGEVVVVDEEFGIRITEILGLEDGR